QVAARRRLGAGARPPACCGERSLVRTAPLAEEASHVGERPEVAQLGGVDDRAYGLDDAVSDVEREHVDEPSVPIDDDRAGLAVHLRRLDGDAELAHLPAEADQQAADALPAGDRMRPRRARSAAVAVDDDVA